MAQAHVLTAKLVKAMAHPTRLQILEILAQEESCVCHLTAILKQRQAYVSQQLMVLREADLVRDRRDGIMIYYSLSDARLAAVLAVLRDVLQNQNPAIPFAMPPHSPVAGCPCPKCSPEEGCCSH